MLAKLCITCNLFGCITVTLQTTSLNLANCIRQQEFLDSKTKKSLPDVWSLGVYIYSLVAKRKIITRNSTFRAKYMSLFPLKANIEY